MKAFEFEVIMKNNGKIEIIEFKQMDIDTEYDNRGFMKMIQEKSCFERFLPLIFL
jgi:hypothetical protein